MQMNEHQANLAYLDEEFNLDLSSETPMVVEDFILGMQLTLAEGYDVDQAISITCDNLLITPTYADMAVVERTRKDARLANARLQSQLWGFTK